MIFLKVLIGLTVVKAGVYAAVEKKTVSRFRLATLQNEPFIKAVNDNQKLLDNFCGTVGSEEICVLHGDIQDDLTTYLRDCPDPDQGGEVYAPECKTCQIHTGVEDPRESVDFSLPRCDECAICDIGDPELYSYDCSNIDSVDACAVKNCDGECVGEGASDPTPEPPTAPPESPKASCGSIEGSPELICIYPEVPHDDLTTYFRACSVNEEDQVLFADCNTCQIHTGVDDPNVINFSLPRCDECSICDPDDEQLISYDCSNTHPDELCAVRNCAGECGRADSPPATPEPSTPASTPLPTPKPSTPAPTALPTPKPSTPSGDGSCEPNSDVIGLNTCTFEGLPFDGLESVFEGCPPTMESLHECAFCNMFEMVNAGGASLRNRRCNSCALCTGFDASAYEFDCSNIDEDDPCYVMDCNEACIGVGGTGRVEGTSSGYESKDMILLLAVVLMAMGALMVE